MMSKREPCNDVIHEVKSEASPQVHQGLGDSNSVECKAFYLDAKTVGQYPLK